MRRIGIRTPHTALPELTQWSCPQAWSAWARRTFLKRWPHRLIPILPCSYSSGLWRLLKDTNGAGGGGGGDGLQAEGRGLPEPPRQGKAEARTQSINTGAGRLSLSAQPRTPNPAAPLRPQEPLSPPPSHRQLEPESRAASQETKAAQRPPSRPPPGASICTSRESNISRTS